MLVKMLPGLAIAFVLALAFSLAPSGTPSRKRQGQPAKKTEARFSHRAQLASQDAAPATAARTTVPVAGPAIEQDMFAAASPVAAPGAPANVSVPLAASADLLMHSILVDRAAPYSDLVAADSDAAGYAGVGSPMPLTVSSGSTGAGNALASVPACTSAAAACPDPPDRGIYVWGKYSMQNEEKKHSGNPSKYTAYEMDLNTVSVGFLKDWSPTTRLGLSVDLLDGEVKSRHANDTFKNDVSGWVLNADIVTAIDKFNIDARILYGSPELKGSGLTNGLYRKEGKHKATLMGFSGNVGIPLKFGDDIKLAPELGINYRKLKSKAYDYTVAGFPMTMPSQDSDSLLVPLTVDLKKDIPFCAGMFTPRATLGIIKEFKDSALGYRTFNASAASYLSPTRTADKAPSTYYQFGLGLDLVTTNGWNVALDFHHLKASNFSNNTFSLDVGKCF